MKKFYSSKTLLKMACAAVWKKRFCPTYFARVFWSDLEYILYDMRVGHF